MTPPKGRPGRRPLAPQVGILTVRIDQRVIDELRRQSELSGLAVSVLIRNAIAEYLGEEPDV